MGFKDCDKVLPPSTFVSLPDDGDTEVMIFIGEPVPREEEYRGQKRYRYYFPVVTQEGLQVWGLGCKLYRVLRNDWANYAQKCFNVTRHGESGSQTTTYSFEAVKQPKELTRKADRFTAPVVKKFLAQVQVFGVGETEGDGIPI